MSKPSKVPYPGQSLLYASSLGDLVFTSCRLGQAKTSADVYGFCYNCSLTKDQQKELHDLIKGGEINVLQRAMLAKKEAPGSRYVMDYLETEVS